MQVKKENHIPGKRGMYHPGYIQTSMVKKEI